MEEKEKIGKAQDGIDRWSKKRESILKKLQGPDVKSIASEAHAELKTQYGAYLDQVDETVNTIRKRRAHFLKGFSLYKELQSKVEAFARMMEFCLRIADPNYYGKYPKNKPIVGRVRDIDGREDVENRIKEGKNSLRWDKTSCHLFRANEARLKMGVLAYNILKIIRQFYVWGEPVKRSMEWLILRLIKVGTRVSYHARRWHVHVASAFPLRRHYRSVLGWQY